MEDDIIKENIKRSSFTKEIEENTIFTKTLTKTF